MDVFALRNVPYDASLRFTPDWQRFFATYWSTVPSWWLTPHSLSRRTLHLVPWLKTNDDELIWFENIECAQSENRYDLPRKNVPVRLAALLGGLRPLVALSCGLRPLVALSCDLHRVATVPFWWLAGFACFTLKMGDIFHKLKRYFGHKLAK